MILGAMSRSTYPTPTLVGIKIMNTSNQQQKLHYPKNKNQTINNTGPLPRLCGAARKRFHYLLNTGLSPEEARLQAINRMNVTRKQPPVGNKNIPTTSRSSNWRAAISPTPSQIERLPVQARLGAPVLRGPSLQAERPLAVEDEDYSKECLNLAILPGDYPSELWSEPQLEAVQQSIIDLIRRQGEDMVKPKFSGCSFRKGWLSVSCSDINTVNWLRAMDTRLRPWEGASLQVISESDVPFKRIFAGIFPTLPDRSVKYALRLIDAQNDGLAVHDWQMIYRGQMGPLMKLIISVDSYSAEMLRKRDYQLNYGFSSVRFQPLEMAQ